MSDTERWLAEQMRVRLDRQVEGMILGGQPAMTTSAAGTGALPLDADELLRLMGRLRAEQRWLGGRPVRAMKVGRVELEYVRRACQPAPSSVLGSLMPVGDYCWGIPCYEVGLHSYFELRYEDEAPTLEALNGWLEQEPRAVYGKVVAE